jgi:DNA polymerase III subunit delta
MKNGELTANLKQHRLHPLYFFYGEEDFLIQEALDLLIETVVDPGGRDFNYSMLYCRDTPASEMVNICQTLPFMSERRLVIARDFDVLKAADLEEIIPYLRDPSPSTCLVMVSNQARYEKKSVLSAVEARGAVVRFYPLLDREIVGWIEQWAKTHGLAIQRDAAQYLWQAIGNDLQKLSSELQKTEIFMKDRKTITTADVKTVVGDFRDFTSFDLAAELGRKHGEKALVILSRLIQEGEAPVGILGSIAWNFRRLLQAKAMEAAGTGKDEIMKKLRIIFHQTGIFREQMQSYTRDELQAAFSALLAADRQLKSSGLNGKLVLERMILKLCSD